MRERKILNMRFKNPLLNAIGFLYGLLIRTGQNLQSLFLFYMRIVWGYEFILIGWHRLIDVEKTTSFFETLNTFHLSISSYLIGGSELVGGICLFVGLASRLVCIPLTIILFTALCYAAHVAHFTHCHEIFMPLIFAQQTPFPFLITCFLIFIFGPGKISLDAWIKRWAEKQPKY